MLENLDISNIGEVSQNLDTDFVNALNSAYDMKAKASRFDEIEALGDIKLAYLDDKTDHDIDDMDELMMVRLECTLCLN